MLKKTILISSLLLTTVNYAQLRVGIESNSQYYIDDDKIKLEESEKDNRFRSNNYIKLDYSIGDFEFGVQGEGYLPHATLNLNPQLKDFNLGHAFVRYNNYDKGIDITAGHIYEQFGSGLALRFWEDRALGLNNALLGGRVKYNLNDYAQFKFLGGKQRIGMGLDLSEGVIYGMDTEIDITKITGKDDYTIKLGATYVGRYEDITKLYPEVPKTTDVLGPRIEYFGEKFNFSTEYLYKTKDTHVETNDIQSQVQRAGSALLVNMGYNSGAFAVNVNLRRLENFTFYSQRNMQGNLFNYGMINYVPSLTKQYEHSLQNIYVYQAQPQLIYYLTGREKQGEIGGQFDMVFEAESGSFLGGETGASFAVNGSYWSGLKNTINKSITQGVYGEDIEIIDLQTDFLSFGDKYYQDFGLEYRKTFSKKWNSIFSYVQQFYNSALIVDKPYRVDVHNLAWDNTYFLDDTKSIRLELQHQWANSERKNWAGGTFEYIHNKMWSFFVHDMYNYGSDDINERLHYYSVGGAFTKGATRVALNYGRQRGGMLCVGGVCRWVPESAGLTLNITTNF